MNEIYQVELLDTEDNMADHHYNTIEEIAQAMSGRIPPKKSKKKPKKKKKRGHINERTRDINAMIDKI